MLTQPRYQDHPDDLSGLPVLAMATCVYRLDVLESIMDSRVVLSVSGRDTVSLAGKSSLTPY